MNDNTIILIVHGLRKFEKSRYERSVLDTAKPRGCVPGEASCAVIVIYRNESKCFSHFYEGVIADVFLNYLSFSIRGKCDESMLIL